jgi:hypothetical protein
VQLTVVTRWRDSARELSGTRTTTVYGTGSPSAVESALRAAGMPRAGATASQPLLRVGAHGIPQDGDQVIPQVLAVLLV